FANTLKYVFMATSANFGNMFSMAGVSLLLPFLPLLPKQILLTNLLTDFPEMTIATDNVDNEMVEYPRRWDIKAIRKFMMTFGLLSSVFDYLNVWFASAGFSCDSGSIPNRMVLGVRLFSVTNCAGHSKPETLLQEQTVEISVCGDSLIGCPDADFALHSIWPDFWV